MLLRTTSAAKAESETLAIPDLPVVRLIAEGVRVKPPENMIYSSDPKTSFDAQGNDYIIKGPDPEIVAAEAIAHMLAQYLGLRVPGYSLATLGIETPYYFASHKLQNAQRNCEPWLAENRQFVADVMVFDAWLANTDRNIGNIMAEPNSDPKLRPRLVAIDFEKSWCARSRFPLSQLEMEAPSAKLWPTGDLGKKMRGVPLPHEFVARIKALPDSLIGRTVDVASSLLEDFTWGDSTKLVLCARKARLEKIVSEVWK